MSLGRDMCDFCDALSDVYDRFPECVDCGARACPDHEQPGTFFEDEGYKMCQCAYCYRDQQEMEREMDNLEAESDTEVSDVDFS